MKDQTLKRECLKTLRRLKMRISKIIYHRDGNEKYLEYKDTISHYIEDITLDDQNPIMTVKAAMSYAINAIFPNSLFVIKYIIRSVSRIGFMAINIAEFVTTTAFNKLFLSYSNYLIKIIEHSFKDEVLDIENIEKEMRIKNKKMINEVKKLSKEALLDNTYNKTMEKYEELKEKTEI